MRQVYLAATGMNRGKTTVALGLLAGSSAAASTPGFIKPVGQRYEHRRRRAGRRGRHPHARGLRPDRPAGGHEPGPHPARLHQGLHQRRRRRGPAARASGRPTASSPTGTRSLLIEGTGHAGVGSVIGLSNAVVAAMLEAPRGHRQRGAASAGRSTRSCSTHASSRATASRSLGRRQQGRPRRPARPGRACCERGLAPHGIQLLGVLPYRPILSNPTLAMVLEQMQGETAPPGAGPRRGSSTHVAIGAMQPVHVLERIGPGSAAHRARRSRGRRSSMARHARRHSRPATRRRRQTLPASS